MKLRAALSRLGRWWCRLLAVVIVLPAAATPPELRDPAAPAPDRLLELRERLQAHDRAQRALDDDCIDGSSVDPEGQWMNWPNWVNWNNWNNWANWANWNNWRNF